jgi:hypothetical protein
MLTIEPAAMPDRPGAPGCMGRSFGESLEGMKAEGKTINAPSAFTA